MAKNTKIQWADDTTNPVMGCLGCELFPKLARITNTIDRKLQEAGYQWPSGKAYELLEVIIDMAWKALSDEQRDPGYGLLPGVTTSSIYHARDVVGQEVAKLLDEDAAKLVVETRRCLLRQAAGEPANARGPAAETERFAWRRLE